MKTGKTILKGLALFAATLALAACGSTTEETTASSSEAATTASSSTTETAAWKDGTYTAESAADDYGYKIVHTITIKDGKITESNFDYQAEDGSLKSENEEYNTKMKEKSGVSAAEALEKLNAALVETQSADVEVVSGATHTSEDFVKSTTALLAAAAEGKTETIQLD
ncbi:FMN-binding protein [Streptococcus suis]|uniref:FMN-binding protein n=1 Tax=Streptococcus suis TaxID=1307 RepID=A0A4T2GJ64_STRSU|nr:FMN-binding protein [Streptococcus suis]MBM7270374.1 FMN-binding protein [Streptococcus suis]MBM7315165.1 FMN-binding protein [Streptococcus suis]TIH98948.1 FMN-binding protein [Streptococcus suis]